MSYKDQANPHLKRKKGCQQPETSNDPARSVPGFVDEFGRPLSKTKESQNEKTTPEDVPTNLPPSKPKPPFWKAQWFWTAVGSVASVIGVWLINKQLSLQHVATEMGNRPRITIQKIEIGPLMHDQALTVMFYMSNSGQGIATDLWAHTWATVTWDPPDIRDFGPGKRRMTGLGSSATIAPNTSQGVIEHLLLGGWGEPLVPITEEQITRVRMKQLHLWVYGVISYSDDFCMERRQTFCFHWDPDLSLVFCEHGNIEYPCDHRRPD